MFKYKIKIILKSGYEIRLRASEYDYDLYGESQSNYLTLKKRDNKDLFIDIDEIAAIIVKQWYQRWE